VISSASGMWWVMAIMAVRVIFLPTGLFVHEADKVLHTSSRLPDSEKPESVSACFDDGLCQLWAPCAGWSQINARVVLSTPGKIAVQFLFNGGYLLFC